MTYREELINYCETHQGVGWGDLEEAFGKPRRNMRACLERNHRLDLCYALDDASGFKRPYWKRLVRHIQNDEAVTWWELSTLFEGRSDTTLKNTLYSHHRIDLIQQVDKASKEAGL